MKFSLLISVYHGDDPNFLDEAFQSIWESQALKPDEIVIVNDGPVPPEIETCIDRLASRAPVNRVRLPVNVGLGLALSEGIKHCSYDWVARMDSDDISISSRFERQVAFLIKHPEVDVLGSFIEEFTDAPEQIIATRKVPENNNGIRKMLKIRNAMNHVSVFMRKERVMKSGNYQSMPYFEDYFLWARMACIGACFHNLQEPLVRVRVGEAMIGRRKGRAYVQKELNFFNALCKLQFINRYQYFMALFLRLPLRFLPGNILTYFYKKIARS